MTAVEDGFEVQVAPGGPTGGAYRGDDLPGSHAVSGLHPDPLQVVVSGDEAVAVVKLHAVTAAPGMPTGGTDNTGIC